MTCGFALSNLRGTVIRSLRIHPLSFAAIGLKAGCSRHSLLQDTLTATRRISLLSQQTQNSSFRRLQSRRLSTTPQEVENTNVGHSRFLAEASKDEKWSQGAADRNPADVAEVTSEEFDSITEGKGKLSPTSSHLFKLIIPLNHGRRHGEGRARTPPPTVFLLHPSQPLSHVSRLILASLAPATPSISFQSKTPRGHTIQWSDSTDVQDFIRDAARTREFTVCIADPGEDEPHTIIPVEVPTFADRTRFLRRRLAVVEEELAQMEALKQACDDEAHRGARRMALGGFGILVVYWGAVARLTFWDYGWDVMEPITYLSGLSMVILGYLWFLYRGREVSYSSVLHHSVSARRDALYKSRGLDIDRWMDLVSEAKSIRREISKIAEDYDERRWKESEDEREAREKNERKEPEDVQDTVRHNIDQAGGRD
ncbi:hypothetical protein K466DRAFT_584650 [Polyporus arcularius HHB13444]|uniref:Calcium uniporter protein, mitochondrial n=1 Tax=Polyporus arcularius HHB13444 TaxID=1314778 RepID=A0A5C3PJG6_9APHY|nr:hypothetical protein K466DRAFT_584650 [Polyporus arcularius HHB13444]